MISIYVTSGKWKVYRKGANRALKVCRDKTEAIQFGNRLALETKDELVVHSKDDSVDFVLDYTNLP